jgi:hypothetical protein
MATVTGRKARLTEKLSWYFERGPHRVWDRFSPEDQEWMLRDDQEAGTRVSLVLVALITTGLALAIVALLAVLLTQ